MNYNINDILPYVENYNFGEFFTESEEDFLISCIKCDEAHDFDWEDGASKLVIIPEYNDFVIKIPFNGSYNLMSEEYIDFSQNYCETEIDLYEKIIAENPIFAQFFLPLTRVEEFEKYDIYIQAKCKTFNNTNNEERKSSYSKESLAKSTEFGKKVFTRLPVDWIAGVLEVLKDESLLEEFINVLDKYDIGQDLHYGNIGYYNNKPIILDYAGFYE